MRRPPVVYVGDPVSILADMSAGGNRRIRPLTGYRVFTYCQVARPTSQVIVCFTAGIYFSRVARMDCFTSPAHAHRRLPVASLDDLRRADADSAPAGTAENGMPRSCRPRMQGTFAAPRDSWRGVLPRNITKPAIPLISPARGSTGLCALASQQNLRCSVPLQSAPT